MSKFFTKTSAFVFVCSSLLFAADNAAITSEEDSKPPVVGAVLNLSEVITDIVNAEPAVLPFQECVLNFSDHAQTARSCAKIATYLIVEKTTGTLDLADIGYLTFEAIAAASRKTPAAYGKLAPYFADEKAVYQNIGQVIGSIEVASHDLSVLGNFESCKAFVEKTIATDLEKLLTRLGASAEDQADFTLLETVFTPMFAQLLNKTYTGTMNAAAAFDAVIEDSVPAGCFCFGRSKAGKK
jgi:hypothetical protein